MSESTLSLKISHLRDALAVEFMGAADYAALASDTAQQGRINLAIDAGLRRFFTPPKTEINGRRESHSWSFRWQIASLTLQAAYTTGTVTIVNGVVTLAGGTFPSHAANCQLTIDGTDYEVSIRTDGTHLTLVDTTLDADAGTEFSLHQDDYDLPDDFGSLVGEYMTYEPSASIRTRFTVADEGRIRTLRQSSLSTSGQYPYVAATREKTPVTTDGGRKELLLWPAVTTAALLTIRYFSIPSITAIGAAGTEYIPGSTEHSETIMAAVLAAGERLIEDREGTHTQYFLERLEASIDVDRRTNRGTDLGYNGDNSRHRRGPRLPRGWSPNPVTYNP